MVCHRVLSMKSHMTGTLLEIVHGQVLQAIPVHFSKSAEPRCSSMDSGNRCQAVVRTLEAPHSTYPTNRKHRDHLPCALYSPDALAGSCCFAQADGLALAADADRRTTLRRREARQKAAASSSHLRRSMQAKRRTLQGVLGPLGRLERSLGAFRPRGVWSPYLGGQCWAP